VRRTPALALSTALTATLAVVTLTACTAAPAAGCEATPSGAASQSVKADGAFGEAITVDSSYPLDVTTTERSVLIDGTGAPLDDGQRANLQYLILNGTTGEVIEDSRELAEEPIPFDYIAGTSIPGMESALHCATAGSRIAAVIPPAEGFGDAGIPEVGLEPGQSLLFVADVMSIEPTPSAAPQGPVDLPTPAEWTGTVPAVDLAADPPTVAIPEAPAPTELVLTVLEEGDGEVVPNPATFTVDYVGVSWDTREVFDSSYASGTPLTLGLGDVIPGFSAAIAGQRVGSTVLVSIPPELGYGTDPSAHQLGGQTLVFLIHIVSYQ